MGGADATGGRWLRLAALGIAPVFLLLGLAAAVQAFRGGFSPDFLSYWAAGRMAAGGDAASAYDIARHHAIEAAAVPRAGQLPFAYPPTFLLLLLPFGLLPFGIAFAAWVAITLMLYLIAAWRLIDLRLAIAQAAAAANLVIGQNGFLTAAIFIRGTALIERRPLLAGAILGLLSVKPQLALLLPVALIAGREWRALLGAVLSSVTLLGLAFVLFGGGAFDGFRAMAGQSAQWLSGSRWPWGELASPFALLRFFGIAAAPALAGHAAIALAASAATAWAWARKAEQRVPVLAAATLLVPPYLFTYDGLLLTVPLAWAFRHRPGAGLAIWLLSLLPLAGYFLPWPNAIPIAAGLALWLLLRPSPHQV